MQNPDLCLDSADWSCADHMHSPKKKNSLAIHTKLSMCRMDTVQSVLSGEEEEKRSQDQTAIYTMQRINPLGSTVSITSMLSCIYRLILLLWV
ncbi:unnamed protein product [Staurois parvus]|uniref:Uncharacterized protein n=1 Tax=Staurois parvus TaxID=386267 RepID=A0ABN9DWL6_9NEOB|nr:unnamed protein product [Staurois parvus]